MPSSLPITFRTMKKKVYNTKTSIEWLKQTEISYFAIVGKLVNSKYDVSWCEDPKLLPSGASSTGLTTSSARHLVGERKKNEVCGKSISLQTQLESSMHVPKFGGFFLEEDIW